MPTDETNERPRTPLPPVKWRAPTAHPQPPLSDPEKRAAAIQMGGEMMEMTYLTEEVSMIGRDMESGANADIARIIDEAYARMCEAGSLQIARDAGLFSFSLPDGAIGARIYGAGHHGEFIPVDQSPIDLRPSPEHDRKTLHWVSRSDGKTEWWIWADLAQRWTVPQDDGHSDVNGISMFSSILPRDAHEMGYRYLGPAEWDHGDGTRAIAAAVTAMRANNELLTERHEHKTLIAALQASYSRMLCWRQDLWTIMEQGWCSKEAIDDNVLTEAMAQGMGWSRDPRTDCWRKPGMAFDAATFGYRPSPPVAAHNSTHNPTPETGKRPDPWLRAMRGGDGVPR